MSENVISIDVVGMDGAMRALLLRPRLVREGARLGMWKTTVRIRGRVKASFGQPGKPQRRSGHLSRSVDNRVDEGETVITGQVGSTMPYRTGYAAILEKGGPLPAMVIRARPGKVLAWPVGFGQIAHSGALGAGRTMKQARGAAIRASKRLGGSGYRGFAFARSVKIPARYQRAMPYLQPALVEDRPQIEPTFKAEIGAALTKAPKR